MTLTIRCDRCSKEVSRDIMGETLNNDIIRKFGFYNAHNGKNNVLLCCECKNGLKELKDQLEKYVKNETCSYFDNCEGKVKDNDERDIDGKKNGRI